ncbi:hypothetical protein D3C78_1028830 [compost metagenome]
MADLGFQLLDLIVLSARLTYRPREVRLGALELDFGIYRIQCYQRAMSGNIIRVVAIDDRHRATDLRGDLDDIALDVGIIGRLRAHTGHVPDTQRY